jgi:hypothetical protein
MTIITIVIIFLALCFLSIIVRVRILGENVVIVPTDWIHTRSLPEEFEIGIDVYQYLGFINPKAVATFVVNK